MFNSRKRPGFSRFDFLVLAVINVCLVGVLIVVVAVARRNSEARVTTMNNLAHCAKATLLCNDQFKKFPPYFGIYGAKTTPLTFHVHMLPFVEQDPLSCGPAPVGVVHKFLSPMDGSQTDNGINACNFPVNLRLFCAEGGLGSLGIQAKLIYPKPGYTILDGVSQTLLFATKPMNCGANGGSLWLDPGNNGQDSPTAATFGVSMGLWQQAPSREDCDPLTGTAVSFNKDAIQVAMCDASVRTVAVGISQQTWQAVHTPGASDVAGPDWVE
jgi:hypothetical protein